MGRYKLIEGNVGSYRDWFPPMMQTNFGDLTSMKAGVNLTLLFDIESRCNCLNK